VAAHNHLGDGTQTRSFTYVTDQIEGLLRLAALDQAHGSIVNIGNDKETKIIDMARMVLDITGSMICNNLPSPARGRSHA